MTFGDQSERTPLRRMDTILPGGSPAATARQEPSQPAGPCHRRQDRAVKSPPGKAGDLSRRSGAEVCQLPTSVQFVGHALRYALVRPGRAVVHLVFDQNGAKV